MTSVRASIRWKPDRTRPTVRTSRSEWASSVSEKTSPSRSASAALWQAISTRSPAAALSSSALTLRQVAREPLDALDPQVTGRLQRIGGERGDGDRREADQPLETGVRRRRARGASGTRLRYWRPSSRRSLGSSRATQVPSGKKSAGWPKLAGSSIVETERPRSR